MMWLKEKWLKSCNESLTWKKHKRQLRGDNKEAGEEAYAPKNGKNDQIWAVGSYRVKRVWKEVVENKVIEK